MMDFDPSLIYLFILSSYLMHNLLSAFNNVNRIYTYVYILINLNYIQTLGELLHSTIALIFHKCFDILLCNHSHKCMNIYL